jgi:hypothetical protein
MTDVTNTGTFDNTVSGTINSLTNSGTATNEGTITTTVTNTSGTFTNSGTTGDWTNSGTITNNGTMSNGTNSGTYTNSGTVGTVNNSGIFTMNSGTASDITNSGTLTYNSGIVNSVSNSGTYNVSGAANTVALNGYTQTVSGTTVIKLAPSGVQKFNINGPATLAGTLSLNTAVGPYSYSRLPIIAASSVVGKYDILSLSHDYLSPLGYELAYTDTSVNLHITPSSVATQQGLNAVASDLKTIDSIVSSQVGGAVGSDCPSTGENGGCVSMSYGINKTGTGSLQNGGITVTTNITDNFRIGAFADQSTDPKTDTVTYKSSAPVIGATVGYNNGEGLDITASAAVGSGQYTITRPTIAYAENGKGISAVNSQAYQLKAAYTIPLMTDVTLTPYAGLRYTNLNVGGYNETNAVYPLSVVAYSQKSTDVIAGSTLSVVLTDELTASLSAGITQNISATPGSISGTSDIVNLKTISTPLASSNATSLGLGAGLSYQVAPGQHINLNVGWQQKSLTSPDVTGVGISYSISF